MKKTNTYYVDSQGSCHYLLMANEGSYFMWETIYGTHHYNVQDAINAIRQLGISDIHCDLPKRERRRS